MAEKRGPGRPKGKLLIDVNDIVGKRIGMLEVVRHEYYKYVTFKCGTRFKHYYLCKCDCGNITIVDRCQILNNNVRSCGCIKRKLFK